MNGEGRFFHTITSGGTINTHLSIALPDSKKEA